MPKFMNFIDNNEADKSCRFVTIETKRHDLLGKIEYYSHWKQFIFIPDYGAGFSFDCLQGITKKLIEMNKGV